MLYDSVSFFRNNTINIIISLTQLITKIVHLIDIFLNINYTENNSTVIAIDGAVTHVRLEEIEWICLHSNATGCQLYACFCFNRTIGT